MIIKIIINLDNIIMIIWNFSTLSGLLWLNRWANECEMSSPLYPILLNNHHPNHHCNGFNVTIIFILIIDRNQFRRSLTSSNFQLSANECLMSPLLGFPYCSTHFWSGGRWSWSWWWSLSSQWSWWSFSFFSYCNRCSILHNFLFIRI